MLVDQKLVLIRDRVSADRHFVNGEPLFSSYTRDVSSYAECNHLLTALMQPHVLKSIMSPLGQILSTEGFYSVLSPAYCLYNSYDLFRSFNEVYTDSYPSQSVEHEKRLMYGQFHNCHGSSRSKNTLGLDIMIHDSRFKGLNSVSDDGALDFVLCWHQDWNNYWHWHFEALPRLLLLALLVKRGIFDYRMIRFWVIGKKLSKFQLQTIVLVLGAVPSINYARRGLFSPRLLHISPPYPSSFHPIVIKELASQLRMTGDASLSQDKLLVAREIASNGRKLENSEEVTSSLSSKGYRVLNPGVYSYLTQQSFFSSCQSVVCPHGASSVNLIFCNQGTKVIEIHPENYIHPEPYVISDALGLDYSFCIGSHLKGVGSESRYRVDIDGLHRLVS